MKLIQRLERKLSWPKKKQSPVHNTVKKEKLEKTNRKAKKFANNTAIKVNDNEFSQYIRFASPLRTVATTSVPTYEIVNIRTRSPFQENVIPSLVKNYNNQCSYRFSSPRSEEQFDTVMHIYDTIDNNHHHRPITPVLLDQDKYADVNNSSTSTTITTTSSNRRATMRNRIKTNPWFNSPWAGKKTFGTRKQDTNWHGTVENDYESIDNLDWQSNKENFNFFQPLISANRSLITSGKVHDNKLNYEQQSQPVQQCSTLTLDHHRTNLNLNERSIPHHFAAYPQSSLDRRVDKEDEICVDIVAPSPEFVTQSHQICSEITNYFREPYSQDTCSHSCDSHACTQTGNNDRTCPSAADENNHNKFDSMETIDLTPDLNDSFDHTMSEWSLHDEELFYLPEHHHNQAKINVHLISNFTNSIPGRSQSSISAKERKILERNHHNNHKSIVSKRKRPESLYSTRQSKKLDKLKFQLKEVVHAAILEAKKEDTKKV